MSVPGSSIGTADACFADRTHRGIDHWWFTTLEQRPFVIGGNRWITQVVGIHREQRDLWIQLEAVGEQPRAFVIRIHPETTLEQAVAAIERAWREAVPPAP